MSSKSVPVFRREAVAWLALPVLALAAAYWWWAIGRPVNLPDAPSARIACVSYAPFRQAGESPLDPGVFVTPERIDADLRALSQRFDCVRTYSQGQGLSAVPQFAGRYGMKVLLGIWLGNNRKANAEQIRLGIATARKYPQVVRAVIVGNEVLLRGDLSSAQLAADIAQVRAAVPEPVTYADVWQFWLRHPELASSVDFVTIHILPYWEDKPVAPERAVQHVADVYARIQQAFPGKRVMIGETGWPSAGRPRQAASASVVNEARYLREFLRYAAAAKLPYNVIEAFDQPWKRALEGTAGGYWGIFDAHALPKFPMQGPVVEDPHWWLGWLAAGAGGVLFALTGALRRGRRGWRETAALGLAGIASGGALAWQFRQMWFACRNPWEWTVSLVACVLALFTALRLAQWIAARLAGATRSFGPGACRSYGIESENLPARGQTTTISPADSGSIGQESAEIWTAQEDLQPILHKSDRLLGWLRFGWTFALTYYDLLLVFDGRYRDFPLGLFLLPCVGYALAGGLTIPGKRALPRLEERFVAAWLPVLGVVVVVQEAGLNPVAWLWLGLNLLLAASVLIDWRGARIRLQAQQA